jgi:hypothetical protein
LAVYHSWNKNPQTLVDKMESLKYNRIMTTMMCAHLARSYLLVCNTASDQNQILNQNLRMKTNVTTCLLALCIWATNSNAQLLFDDFNNGMINSSLWTTSLPFGSSQVFESGDRLNMIARGGINTVQPLPTSFEITGRFRFTGQEDHFGITIRSDLAFANSFMEKYGVRVKFSDNGQSLTMLEYNTDNTINTIAALSYPFAANTDYDFRITDDGNNIRLFMGGSLTPAIEASTTFRAGDMMAIYNREFSISRSELDFISVVPEPGTGLIFGLGTVGLFFHRTLRQRSRTFVIV